jgi:hypothetical protein
LSGLPDCLVIGAGCGGRVWAFDANLTVPPLAGGNLELVLGAVTKMQKYIIINTKPYH